MTVERRLAIATDGFRGGVGGQTGTGEDRTFFGPLESEISFSLSSNINEALSSSIQSTQILDSNIETDLTAEVTDTPLETIT